jgi:hypothetical protein
MDDRPRFWRRLKPYWCVVAVIALLMAGWAYYDSTRPWLDCPSGHCPDPGTREYLAAVQRSIDTAPLVAFAIFVLVFAAGAVLRLVILAVRAMLRSLSD